MIATHKGLIYFKSDHIIFDDYSSHLLLYKRLKWQNLTEKWFYFEEISEYVVSKTYYVVIIYDILFILYRTVMYKSKAK